MTSTPDGGRLIERDTRTRALRAGTSAPLVLVLAIASAIGLGAGACREDPPREHVRPLAGSAGAGAGGARAGSAGASGGPRDSSQRDGGSASDRAGATGGSGGGAGGTGTAAGSGRGGGAAFDAGALSTTPPFTKRGLLEAAGQCAMRHYDDFRARARALAEAVQVYADDPSAARADAARSAWAEAMASWQRAELFRFGPAAATPDPGAQNLRDHIYFFPAANACLVDQQIVSRAYAQPSFSASLASARGLSAIEYLLFHTSDSNACSASISINASGSWAALAGAELTQRRAQYAAAAAADVFARAIALVDAWEPGAGDFYAQLVQAGSGSDVFDMDHDAFNALTHALYYIEKEVKDIKLGTPLGYVPDCPNSPDTCPDAVESRYALRSTAHLRQNLVGLRNLFEGCGPGHTGLGFDDWLREVGAGDLAGRMLDAIAVAQQAVEALDPPLEAAIVTHPGEVEIVHTAVKAFTDLLKTEFLSVLDLEPPAAAVGDND